MKKEQKQILAVATLGQGFAIGVTIGIFPLMLEPLEQEFAAPRTQIAFGPILIMLALCSAGVVAGGVLDKGRVRSAMVFGALLLSSGLLMAGLGTNLGWLAAAALASGFAVPFVGPLAGMTLVTRTFDAEQGKAFGIMSMGPGLGSGLFAGLGGFLLQTVEWRQIYLMLGVAVLVVLVPAIVWAIPRELPASGQGAEADGTSGGVSIADVLRRPLFWLSAGVFAISAGIGSAWTSHCAAFLGGDVGIDAKVVAAVVAGQFWMGVPGALCFGILTDRIPVTRLFVGVLGVQAAIFGAYSWGVSPIAAALLGGIFGFATGGLIPLYMALLQDRLEVEILGRAMGLSNLLMMPAMALTVLTAAAIFEADGSYAKATTLLALGMLGAIVCLFLSNRSAERRADGIAEHHRAGLATPHAESPDAVVGQGSATEA